MAVQILLNFLLYSTLEHFHSSCSVGLVVSHPFHKEREMDGARSILTLSVKNALTQALFDLRITKGKKPRRPKPPRWLLNPAALEDDADGEFKFTRCEQEALTVRVGN